MKVPEQVNYLHMTKVSIAVGTPARIAKLISEGQFSTPASRSGGRLTDCRCSHIDERDYDLIRHRSSRY